jgi:hypothetical protein
MTDRLIVRRGYTYHQRIRSKYIYKIYISSDQRISDNWNHIMRPHDMKYIGFKHQRENKQNSDKLVYFVQMSCLNFFSNYEYKIAIK